MKKSIWVYGDSKDNVDLISKCNEQGREIKELFTQFADCRFTEDKADLEYSRTTKAWSESGVPFHPILGVPGFEGKKLFEGKIPNLDSVVSQFKKAASSFGYSGIHLDIEPYHKNHLQIYAKLREEFDCPISAALGKWDYDVLKTINKAVWMSYGWSLNPKDNYADFKQKLKKFAHDCETNECKWSVGLPLVATHANYEKSVHWDTGETKLTGVSMKDCFMHAYELVCKTAEDAAYFDGISIWAILSQPLRDRKKRLCLYPEKLELEHLLLIK